MVQGITPFCGCKEIPENYIDKWFMYFSTNASFKAHIEQGFIGPDSVVFLEETGQLFTNGHFFGVCSADFNALKSVVFNHTKMIQNILGIDGPSVGDGLINNIKDIQEFLSGFTTNDTLMEFINQIKFNLEASIEEVQQTMNQKFIEFSSRIDSLRNEIKQTEDALKARCDLHDSEIALLKSRLSSNENELQRVSKEWAEFSANYSNWQSYVEGRLDTLNQSFLTNQESVIKLHNEMEELNAKINRYDARIENCVSLVQNCYTAIDEVEQKFNALRTEVSDFYQTKGHANGLCPLNEEGMVDAQYLPSYVDDVLEFVSMEDFPKDGEFGKIYVALNTNLTYRWSGTQYIEISKSLGLGELPFTAFPGDRGKNLELSFENHKENFNNPHKVTKEQVGLGLVDNTPDKDKPVSTPVQNAIDDLHQTITGESNTAIEKAINDAKKELTDGFSGMDQTIKQHIADRSNPHEVTKSQVGLSKVDNTSDIDKPVSVPQKIAIDDAKKAGTDAQTAIDLHKANKQNPHEVTKEQVGLSNVDNTSDAQKPVSILQQIAIDHVQDTIDFHKLDNSNPHRVTKEQIGLDRVDNTSDSEKPISTPQLQALKEQRDELMQHITDLAGEVGRVSELESKFNTLLERLESLENNVITREELMEILG